MMGYRHRSDPLSPFPIAATPIWDVVLNPDNATPIDGDPVRIVYARSCLVHYLTFKNKN